MLETYMNVDYLLHATFLVAPSFFEAWHFYNPFDPFQKKNLEHFERLQWKKKQKHK